MAKILIGFPVKDDVSAEFCVSLANLIAYSTQQGHVIDTIKEYGGLYHARNRICRQAIKGKYDYMLQLDTDESFPPYALEHLLARNKDIVTGIYVGGESGHRPVLFTELHGQDKDNPPVGLKHGLPELMKKDFFEVAGCGGGFLLVSYDALVKIEIHQRDWFKPLDGLGEDVSFCKRATNIGFSIYADNTFSIGHVKPITYTLEDWNGEVLQ